MSPDEAWEWWVLTVPRVARTLGFAEPDDPLQQMQVAAGQAAVGAIHKANQARVSELKGKYTPDARPLGNVDPQTSDVARGTVILLRHAFPRALCAPRRRHCWGVAG
jgi:hypothetical protein